MKFKNIFFDFDGVIVDSNEIKSNAFFKLFESYDLKIAKKILKHHKDNIGMSRFDKFQFYLKYYIKDNSLDMNYLEKKFSNLVVQKVIESEFIKGAKEFLNTNYNNFNFFLCTSTPQKEIQKILSKKNIYHFFKKIYGSPINKVEQINNIVKDFKIDKKKSIFIGDSINDYQSAKSCDIKFILMANDSNKEFLKLYKGKFISNFFEFQKLIEKND